MSDVYVYHFMRRGPAGENILSKRRATLETIKCKGEAVVESEIVVDHTEVDGNGFLIGGIDDESHPMHELWAEIRSLERRANSRDREALTLNESGEGARNYLLRLDARVYLLRLESRELRNQAQRLRKQRADSMAGELGNGSTRKSSYSSEAVQQRDRRDRSPGFATGFSAAPHQAIAAASAVTAASTLNTLCGFIRRPQA